MHKIISISVSLVLLAPIALPQATKTPLSTRGPSVASGSQGVVVSGRPAATAAGIEVAVQANPKLVTASEIAERTEGYSGRDLVTLIGNVQQRAVMRILQHKATEIVLTLDDFREEFDSFIRPLAR